MKPAKPGVDRDVTECHPVPGPMALDAALTATLVVSRVHSTFAWILIVALPLPR